MSTPLGIDFGTSNSAVGYMISQTPHLVAVEGDKITIPTALFYDMETKKILFGRNAISAYTDHREGRLLRAIKNVLGTSLINDSTQIGNKKISFQTIIGEFIGHLKDAAEKSLGHEVEYAVLGRPVWFVDNNPQADLEAQKTLQAAALERGFKHVEFQYEPIAAALDYEQTVTKEELALIIDIGGGTSDFSIVRVSPELKKKVDRKSDILANTGVHVGGTDLDRKLSIGQVMPLLGYGNPYRNKPHMELPVSYFHDLATWNKIVFLYNHKTITDLKYLRNNALNPELVDRFIEIVKDRNGHRLAGDVEMAKIALSKHNSTSIDLSYAEPGLKETVNRSAFESEISSETEKISKSILECFAQAHVTPDEIDTVFLTGGGTAIPSIYSACASLVPNAHFVEGDKFASVGTGLAIDSGNKFGPSSIKKLIPNLNGMPTVP